MAVRVELLLACDLWRSCSCAGRTSLVVAKDKVAQGEARLRRRARQEEGWTQERGAGGAVLDACPACASARFAAEVAGTVVPPSRPEYRLPATIKEATERHRRPAAGGGVARPPRALGPVAEYGAPERPRAARSGSECPADRRPRPRWPAQA